MRRSATSRSSATTPERRRLGETLRRRRLERGLTLAHAAVELGVPAKSLRALEWDRRDLLGSPLDAKRIEREYAAFLGLDVGPPTDDIAIRDGRAGAGSAREVLPDVPPRRAIVAGPAESGRSDGPPADDPTVLADRPIQGPFSPRRPTTQQPDEKASVWRVWWRLRRFVVPHWMAIALGLALLAGVAAVELLKPWPLKFAFDHILGHGPLEGETLTLLIGIAALVVGIAVLDGLFNYLLVFFLNRAGRTMVFELRLALFDQIHRLSLQYHSRRATGDLLTRITTDVRAARDVMTTSVAELLMSVIFFVGMSLVLLWLDWQLALVVIGATPLMSIAMFYYVFRIKEFARAERKREGALASVASEALGAIRLVRVFNQEGEAKKRFQAESVASLESGFAASLRDERGSWMINFLSGLVTAAVLLFGVQRVVSGAITEGTLIVFVSYVISLHRPIRTAMKQASKITRATAQVERVAEILEVEAGVTDAPGATRAPRFGGDIEFRNVAFEYEPEQPVLEGINLKIARGKLTAIVGPTGAGKTTLVSLIPRLYDPTDGTVLIDGHDIRTYTLESLRAQISVVLQESVLLRASVAENIAYGQPSASPSEIEAAARAANAHEFIAALPDGYHAEIGERGETLSGGQRQRIAIARAILRDAPIVLLDEPLTGLDAASAAAVLEALNRLMSGKTVLVISHQPAIRQRADEIVVLEDGRLVQQGRLAEVTGEQGRYRHVVRDARAEVVRQRP